MSLNVRRADTRGDGSSLSRLHHGLFDVVSGDAIRHGLEFPEFGERHGEN